MYIIAGIWTGGNKMNHNNENISMEEIQRLAKSDAGKKLMQLLEGSHSKASDTVRSSMQSGDMEQAKQAIQVFLSDPKTQALLKQLEEENHG
jgi:hypothetical protein